MKLSKTGLKSLAKYCSEIYMLTRNKREGFRLSGVKVPRSIADHVTVAAQLAYIIGELEGLNGEKCASMVLFHDNGETRITDHHKVAARYMNTSQAEMKAFEEQMNLLPAEIKKKILNLQKEYETRTTPEGIVAKDADWLEAALQAKIYMEQGYDAGNWVDNVHQALETKSAKAILQEIKTMEKFTTSWWQGLKKMTYKKLYK